MPKEKDTCVKPKFFSLASWVGKHVKTKNLNNLAFNGKLFTAVASREDGRIRILPLVPRGDGAEIWVSQLNLDVIENDDLVALLKEDLIEMNGKHYIVRACSQGKRPHIVVIKDEKGIQFGQVSQHKLNGDIGRAFRVACDTMFELSRQNDFSKASFIRARDGFAMVAMVSRHNLPG
jgi:hypothetical protein